MTVEVVGYIDDGKGVEGFLVAIDGSTNRPSGGKYHLTWSIDRSKGAKPVHTNAHTGEAKPLKRYIEIDVEAKYFD